MLGNFINQLKAYLISVTNIDSINNVVIELDYFYARTSKCPESIIILYTIKYLEKIQSNYGEVQICISNNHVGDLFKIYNDELDNYYKLVKQYKSTVGPIYNMSVLKKIKNLNNTPKCIELKREIKKAKKQKAKVKKHS